MSAWCTVRAAVIVIMSLISLCKSSSAVVGKMHLGQQGNTDALSSLVGSRAAAWDQVLVQKVYRIVSVGYCQTHIHRSVVDCIVSYKTSCMVFFVAGVMCLWFTEQRW